MWAAPFASISIVWIGAAVLVVTALRGMAIRRTTARHTANELPVIADSSAPYMPRNNPWRVGSSVLVAEDLSRPDEWFYGTVISMSRGLISVRDHSAPYHAITTEAQYAYHPDTRF